MSLFGQHGAWQDKDRLGSEARRAVLRAETISAGRGLRQATPDMLLLALLEDDGGVPIRALVGAGVDVDSLRAALEATVTRDQPAMLGRSPLDAAAREAVVLGVNEARRAGLMQASAGHVLLGLLEARSGAGVGLLARHGVKIPALRAMVNAPEQVESAQAADHFAEAFRSIVQPVGGARACPRCRATLHVSFRYCYHCGARVTENARQ